MKDAASVNFWSRVEESDGCWVWTGARTKGGYGHLGIRGTTIQASHVAFALTRGRWPIAQVLHSCDNPPCVRPDHLTEGTIADNMRDMISRGRAAWQTDPERWSELGRVRANAYWASRK